MATKGNLIEPYGGELVNLLVSDINWMETVKSSAND